MNDRLKPDLSVAVTHLGKIVITQKRAYENQPGKRHHVVSLAPAEARYVRNQIDKQLALLEAISEQGLDSVDG